MIYSFPELSFTILSVIRVKHRDGRFSVGGRPYAALSYRVRGSGSFRLGETEFNSEAGDLLFVPEGASYDVEYNGTEMIVVHFVGCNYKEAENISVENKKLLRDRFEQMLSAWEQKRATNLIKSLIYGAFQEIADSEAHIAQDEVVARAAAIMESRLADADFDIATLARELYVSVATLRRKFTDSFAMSPKQYLTKLRLDRALALLASGHYLVKDVALKCGFPDEKYFSRIIKARFGKSPSELGSSLFL